MAKFDAAKTKAAWNKAVAAHKKNGGNPTQIRPKIASIGQRLKLHEGRDDYRVLKYANGNKFTIDESSLSGIVHAYTLHVALLTGDFKLVLLPFDMEPPAEVARAIKAGLSPFALMGIRMGTSILLATLEANPKSNKELKPICQEVHGGITDIWPEFCGK